MIDWTFGGDYADRADPRAGRAARHGARAVEEAPPEMAVPSRARPCAAAPACDHRHGLGVLSERGGRVLRR